MLVAILAVIFIVFVVWIFYKVCKSENAVGINVEQDVTHELEATLDEHSGGQSSRDGNKVHGKQSSSFPSQETGNPSPALEASPGEHSGHRCEDDKKEHRKLS